ncbi:hypothetical protein B4166_1572 [Caldibacillus thermoamylovorans]|nr:hypothetical protein B4166_1572 [Caldibacillus thermoamylovorans]
MPTYFNTRSHDIDWISFALLILHGEAIDRPKMNGKETW